MTDADAILAAREPMKQAATEAALRRNELEGHCAHDANADRDQRAVAEIGPNREQDQRGQADQVESVYCLVLRRGLNHAPLSLVGAITSAAKSPRWNTSRGLCGWMA